MSPKEITCPNNTQLWFCIQVWIPKVTFIPYTSLYSIRATIFLFRRFPGRLGRAYYTICMYICIYIFFRSWLDTAGSASPKGRLRLVELCCDWAFGLMGNWVQGRRLTYPTFMLCIGDSVRWNLLELCCGMARARRSPSFPSVDSSSISLTLE